MKIQITDRELWLSKVNTALENIYSKQQEENLRYLSSPWYKRWFDYPHYIGHYEEYHAKNLRELLLSEGTDTIYIDSNELWSIEVWQTEATNVQSK